MKKAIALMMALILALGCIPLTASADEYYYPACSYHSESIVDALKSVGVENTSYQHREVIALYNGLQDYEGTADQNQVLLRALKDGVLKNPDYSGTSDTWGPDSIYSCRQYAECAAGGECYTVKDNNAPLRTGASKHDAVIDNVQQGTLLKVIDVVKNNFGNKWAKIEYVDTDNTVKYGFIFEPHIERHVDHSYVTLLDTLYGDLDVCLVCGHATAHVVVEDEGSDFFEFDLLDIANQAVKGDYYDNSSFWGVLGRIIVGELPAFGQAADIRDFVYDATNCSGVAECSTYLTIDAAALLPVAGAFKIISRADNLEKGIVESTKLIDNVRFFPEGTERAVKYSKGIEYTPGPGGKVYPRFEKYAIAEATFDMPTLEAAKNHTGLSGVYYYDAKLANEQCGFTETPKGYVWHHVEDMKTMILVPQDLHSVAKGGMSHTGGASLIRTYLGL